MSVGSISAGIDKLNFGEEQHCLRQRLGLRGEDGELGLLRVDISEADEAGHGIQDEVVGRLLEGDSQQAVGELSGARRDGNQLSLKMIND